MASTAGSAASVHLLLTHGAAPDARSPDGRTALHMAGAHGDLPSARVLLASWADPLARDRAGLTPADLARAAGFDEVAAYLDAATRRHLLTPRGHPDDPRRDPTPCL